VPFSADAEQRHRAKFQGLADLVTDRMDELLDDRYKRAADPEDDEISGSDRFV
jgi:hypothetical protein